MDKELGEIIKEKLRDKGMSLTKLAKILDRKQSTLSYFLQGKFKSAYLNDFFKQFCESEGIEWQSNQEE
ncbi:MAG: helix-turn-helix transcriptional regulator [bacterium]|nr:helix-turn-helix transcriptional regulator [bacterium]